MRGVFEPGINVSSGGITSGQLAANSVVSGIVASGAVIGRSGGGWSIASGTISLFDIAAGGIASGNYASGSMSSFAMSSGAVMSGQVASGAILGSLGGGAFTVASGTIGPNDHGSGSINSGIVASGQLGTNHFTSGAVITAAKFIMYELSGTLTAEPISGVKAVAMNQSGAVQIAMAGSVSGRMPAFGVVFGNLASGIAVSGPVGGVYSVGSFQLPAVSGTFTWGKGLGSQIYVGKSGDLCQFSGSLNSGGFGSGDYAQILGICGPYSGSVTINVDPQVTGFALSGVFKF